MTRAERMKVTRKGETKLRNIFKDQETAKYKKETGADPDKKGKTKILSRVHKRMSTCHNILLRQDTLTTNIGHIILLRR